MPNKEPLHLWPLAKGFVIPFIPLILGILYAVNAGAGAGSADKGDGTNSVEAADDGDSTSFSQVVYSRDGSMHVNKYGYLCDDNVSLEEIADMPSEDDS